MAVGESRTELLNWLNTTLGLNYSKVEQCGTGAAYCQLMDSIYGGVPLSKVKFETNLGSYDGLNNMKILQAAFNKHRITKQIDVEKLIKCRLQDNLELLQWFKRHWMENKDNVTYDAEARRSTSGSASRRTTMNATNIAPPSSTSTRSSRVSSGTPVAQSRRTVLSSLPTTKGDSNRQLETLTQELQQTRSELQETRSELSEYRVSTESLETERNFYFNKLREIEILTENIQNLYERDDSAARQVKLMTVLEVTSQIQEILYSTEKGFEAAAMDTESF